MEGKIGDRLAQPASPVSYEQIQLTPSFSSHPGPSARNVSENAVLYC
jgi:hypothetical protein